MAADPDHRSEAGTGLWSYRAAREMNVRSYIVYVLSDNGTPSMSAIAAFKETWPSAKCVSLRHGLSRAFLYKKLPAS